MFDKGQKQSSTLSCDSSYFILSSVRRPVIDQGPVIDQLVVIGYLIAKDT